MISNLPTDLLAHMLTYLSLMYVEGPVKNLNKWWSKLVDDPKTTNTRKEITFNKHRGCSNVINDMQLYRLINKYRRIKSITLINCPYITDMIIMNISLINKGLTQLFLQNCPYISSESVLQLSKNCPEINYIFLRKCGVMIKKDLVELLKNLPKLIGFVIDNLVIDNTFIDELIQNCPDITSLGLVGNHTISESAVFRITSSAYKLTALYLNCIETPLETILGILKGYPLLSYFYLNRSFTDYELYRISRCTPNLLKVDLSNCNTLTDEGIGHLSRNCSKLTYINIEKCQHITMNGIITLCKNCPDIKDINSKDCYSLIN